MSEVAEIMEEQELQEEVLVLDDMSAEMLLRRIREANEECERMEAWYAEMTKRIRQKRDNVVAWAEAGLKAYFDLVPKKSTKTQQSYELPSGKLTLKKQEPEYERNEDELCAWLQGNGAGEYVKVKKSADWANLKKQLTIAPDGKSMVTADGEIVPGVTVTLRDPKFVVTVK